jgi:hypothetical protein
MHVYLLFVGTRLQLCFIRIVAYAGVSTQLFLKEHNGALLGAGTNQCSFSTVLLSW